MKRLRHADLGIYPRALVSLVRHPAIIVVPLLAAVVSLLLEQLQNLATDPLGGAGGSIFGLIVQMVYGFSFGVAIMYANDVQRSRRTNFDSIWEEARRKAGGILLATIGFYFVLYVAGLVGGLIGGFGSIILQLVAAYFLIYTVPAAAIGGMPGSLALSASIRAVKNDYVGTAILAVVFIALWIALPQFAVAWLAPFGYYAAIFGLAALHAIVLGYLAFPFSKQYDDIAFTRFW